VFVPFHYGYWDTSGSGPDQHAPGRAANEVTISDWDPASKQPLFKTSAVRIERTADGRR
jgi:anaerobic selenocysteine-containing dehydrogenase